MRSVLSKEQQQWLKQYETESGFEPLFVHELESGEISFYELFQKNLRWLEMHQNERYRASEKIVPGMFDDMEDE